MADRPEMLPEWATEDVNDPGTDQPNVAKPPEWKREKGWELHEFPPRQWFNWLHRTTHDWLEYLDERRVVTADGNGTGLFPDTNSLIVLLAVNKNSTGDCLFAVGWRGAGDPTLNDLSDGGLSLGTGAGANHSVTGATATNVVTVGISFPVSGS